MNSLFLTRPYLCRADGFLTLNNGGSRRGGPEFGLLGIGVIMLIVSIAAAAGISAVVA